MFIVTTNDNVVYKMKWKEIDLIEVSSDDFLKGYLSRCINVMCLLGRGFFGCKVPYNSSLNDQCFNTQGN